MNASLLERIATEIADLPALDELEQDYFVHSLDAFNRQTDQVALLRNWLVDYLKASKTTRLAMLSVGCGNGSFDLSILHRVADDYAHVDYVGLDPSDAALTIFKRAATEAELKNVNFEFIPAALGEAMLPSTITFAVAAQSMLYVPEIEDALHVLMGALQPGGKLLIANAPLDALNQLSNIIWRKQWGHKANYSEDIQAALTALGCSHQTHQLQARLDVTNIVEASNADAEAVIDFILQARMHAFPPHTQHDIISYLRSIASQESKRWLLPHPIDVIEVSKP